MLVRSVWQASKAPKFGWKLRLRFLMAASSDYGTLRKLLQPRPGSSLHRHVVQRPEVVGALLWPYQCSAWGAKQRIQRIVSHFDTVDTLPAPFQFECDDKLVLMDLSDIQEDVRIIVDQPSWLLREGQWAVNIFVGKFRAYSVAFSLHGSEIVIGGLQGRSTEGVMETYRKITRSFYGLRPRDLLLEVVRALAKHLELGRILAISDDYRFFRHSYFSGTLDDAIRINYDSIWEDRGGLRYDEFFFELPMSVAHRPLEELPSKKRGMYKKRYELLEGFPERISRSASVDNIIRFRDG